MKSHLEVGPTGPIGVKLENLILPKGTFVTIQGLKNQTELNNKTGNFQKQTIQFIFKK